MGLTPHDFSKVLSLQKSYLQGRGPCLLSRSHLPACSSLGHSSGNTNASKIIRFLALNQAQKTTPILLIFDPDPLIEAQKETHSRLGLRHPPGECQHSNLLRLMSDLAKEFKARVRGALSEGRERLAGAAGCRMAKPQQIHAPLSA